MHQYKIKLTKYSETGSLMQNEYVEEFADNVEQAKAIVYKYDKMKYQTVDEETGEVTTGGKMWKVELMLHCYKVTDKDAYFAQFEE
jgi:hypothetical protein